MFALKRKRRCCHVARATRAHLVTALAMKMSDRSPSIRRAVRVGRTERSLNENHRAAFTGADSDRATVRSTLNRSLKLRGRSHG
jgi:hypothetical protein